MGWLSDVGKSISKAAKKAVKSVKNVTEPLANSVGKIASGKVAEGLGDIGSTTARMGLDIVTVGNKDLVDNYTGGLMTAAENAARGNTKDIARVGVTGTAAVYGGPMGAMAANQAFAGGGDALDGIIAGASGSGGLAGTIGNVAGKVLGKTPSTGNAPTAPPNPIQTPVYIPSPSSGPGIDSNTMMIIGGSVGGLILIMLMMSMQKR